MKYYLIFCLFVFSLSVNAQEITINYSDLGTKVIEHINLHRKTLKLIELQKDILLLQAAQDHSNYMVENNILSHEQKNTIKQFPKDRIKFYKGDIFDTTGENVLFTPIELKKYSKTDTDLLAKRIFLQWKNSPQHYKNIISQKYEFTELAFAIDKKLKRIYATNVFGAKGFIIPNQLSENTFGITERNINCQNIELSDQIHIGNSLRIEGNDVMLYFYSIEKFKAIFKKTSDAIAIDFVDDEQFKCETKNQFDVSTIYDGTLSKPIYRDELLANNSAENKFKIITKVGEIPEHLRSKKLSLNVVFIFTNCACEYVSPIKVDSRSLALFPIAPILEIPKSVTLSNKGIIKTTEHSFAFDRNEIIEKLDNQKDFYTYDQLTNENSFTENDTLQPDNFDFTEKVEQVEEFVEEVLPFEIINEKAHSSQIYSYSSIEGNEQQNRKLYQERALAIAKYGKDILKVDSKPTKIIMEENWETCFIQLEMENLGELASKSKNEIRSYINHNKVYWNDYLNKQRLSKLVVNYYGELKTTNSTNTYYIQLYNELNLRTAIFDKDFNKANLALAKLYESDYSYALFDEIVFNELMTNEKLVQNATAILVKNYNLDYFKTVRFLKHWLTKYDSLSTNTQLNLLNLYCVTNEDLLDNWDVSKTKLANVTKPKTIEEKFLSYETNEALIANHNYVSLYYSNHINDNEGINTYFYKVYESFKNNSKTSKERVNLALFLNHWSVYSLTVKMLKEEMKKPTFSKEEALLLAQTYPIENLNNESKELEYILKRAYQLNKNEWCKWQNENKNLLRNDIIKKEYCKMCDKL